MTQSAEREREIVLLAVQTLAAGQAHLALLASGEPGWNAEVRAKCRDTEQKAEAIERQMRQMVEGLRTP